jgi:hypothetical protein
VLSAQLAIMVLSCVSSVLPAPAHGDPIDPPVAAMIDTTLSSASGQIRQFAFDGDPATTFVSAEKPTAADHFTLVFDRSVAVKSIALQTGQPDGSASLDGGILEASQDGKSFDRLCTIEGGGTELNLENRSIRAIRLKPAADMDHPLAIREFVIESDPSVASFRYPVEVVIDVTDAPEMKEWAMNVARICERAYPMINEELRSDDFKPRHLITMTLKSDYRGVAATSGGRITGSVKFFKEHPDDVGAMVHETVHVVQSYRARNNPGWLVEGVADYVRFFKFEPGKLKPPDPDRVRYNGSYKITAQFLAYLTEKYDRDIVLKLNRVMREGQYTERIFEDLTGKPVQELDEEWRASLRG